MVDHPLRARILEIFEQHNSAHWGRLHRGGLVYLTAQTLHIPELEVHAVVNNIYGEVGLQESDLPIPSDEGYEI